MNERMNTTNTLFFLISRLEDVIDAWDDGEAFPEPWRGILERPVLIKEEEEDDKDLLWKLPPHPDKAVLNDPDMDLTPATPRVS